jgi:hypothetical protein
MLANKMVVFHCHLRHALRPRDMCAPWREEGERLVVNVAAEELTLDLSRDDLGH